MSNYSDSSFDKKNKNNSWYKAFCLIPETARVLDVGCSSGNFGNVLIKEKGCLVDGIEVNPDDAKVATKSLQNVWIKNIEDDDFREIPNNYEVIYFGDVLEHLVDPVSTLKKFKTHLSKEGVIVFSIPNMGHISIRLAILEGKFEYTETGILDKTHIHFYTQNEVYRIFDEAGYRINRFDFVEKDYPRDLIEKTLKSIGLIANDNFYKLAASTSASAFQFVGSAKPSSIKKHKLEQFGPIDLFESFYNDKTKEYEDKLKRLSEKNNKLEEIVKYKEKHPARNLASSLRKIKK